MCVTEYNDEEYHNGLCVNTTYKGFPGLLGTVLGHVGNHIKSCDEGIQPMILFIHSFDSKFSCRLSGLANLKVPGRKQTNLE